MPHRIEDEMPPDRFIEFGMPSEHNPLGEMYPSSWQQLEDAKGGCGWLRNKEQAMQAGMAFGVDGYNDEMGY